MQTQPCNSHLCKLGITLPISAYFTRLTSSGHEMNGCYTDLQKQDGFLLFWKTQSYVSLIYGLWFVLTVFYKVPTLCQGLPRCHRGKRTRLPMYETWIWSLGLGRSPGEGNGYLLQCSCLGNHMDRGAWRAAVHEGTDVPATAEQLKSSSAAYWPWAGCFCTDCFL